MSLKVPQNFEKLKTEKKTALIKFFAQTIEKFPIKFIKSLRSKDRFWY